MVETNNSRERESGRQRRRNPLNIMKAWKEEEEDEERVVSNIESAFIKATEKFSDSWAQVPDIPNFS